MRIVFLMFSGLFLIGGLKAHDVDWWENPYGFFPGDPMIFYYPRELSGHFYVDPSFYEPCWVVVNLDPSTSTLVNAQVLPPNPANSVSVLVQILRAPSNHIETATITGEWHATGFPLLSGCTAITPNKFSVPIVVSDQVPPWQFQVSANRQWFMIDAGFSSALQFSSCLTGPWLNIGQGQMFTVENRMRVGYFQRSKDLGGYVGGMATDNSGNPLMGLIFRLFYGGVSATTDSSGTYSIPQLPYGMNLMSLTNPIIGASLNIVVPATNNPATNNPANIKVAMAADPIVAVTNACNCTPWCAIGFCTMPSGSTPIYYAGGANSASGAPSCDTQVTVTPPSGPSFTISPGSGHQHNSGPNPAAGTWTVTTTVCDKTKSATITVP
jgi:hypothetical protein